ncbi:hypothetical protein MNEG_15086 [Monoraphidium neglectum]|uniref:Uncharacterized protein n=1 Tax=Monoraphidium neglectum TaxID=145388 RepID=A0A0D2LSY3_9CHLO|nr:hypothetical protein MNEG_15086 [Monoraphidium neglectum]KIY92876.1 hypothetical protein MNEG_15086 [Monoraphidium neglectum]|eukprot:XP_013891896.1 hypothetical protein MNEG_15086 [Monoraphidium neglectum]
MVRTMAARMASRSGAEAPAGAARCEAGVLAIERRCSIVLRRRSSPRTSSWRLRRSPRNDLNSSRICLIMLLSSERGSGPERVGPADREAVGDGAAAASAGAGSRWLPGPDVGPPSDGRVPTRPAAAEGLAGAL